MNKHDVEFLMNLQKELRKQDGEHICCGAHDHQDHNKDHHCHCHCHCQDFYADCKNLNTPRYWSILETTIEPTSSDYADRNAIIIQTTGGDVYEAANEHDLYHFILENYDLEITDEFKNSLDSIKTDLDKLINFYNNCEHCSGSVSIIPVKEVSFFSPHTGCFLTKKAAVDYLNKFGYLHQNPKILGSTAAGNKELEHLLSIIQEVDWQYIYKKLEETDYE